MVERLVHLVLGASRDCCAVFVVSGGALGVAWKMRRRASLLPDGLPDVQIPRDVLVERLLRLLVHQIVIGLGNPLSLRRRRH